MFMVAKDFPSFLGGIERDPDGRIIKAEATIMYFFSKMNVTEAHLEQVQEDSILGDQVGGSLIYRSWANANIDQF